MEIIKTRAAMRAFAYGAGKSVGFVPTMGYLHEGHLALVRRAKAECDIVVVSIFVNPAQFNDPADLEKYPVDLARDRAMLEGAGVDILFVPARDEIFPNGVPALKLRYDDLMARLCGEFRPGHFEGVLLIVHNLLMWVRPQRAYFGLKDYQQYLLIRTMAADLEIPGEIVGCDLVREADGLAMSSRNVRLYENGRREALAISRALFAAEAACKKPGADVPAIKKNMTAALAAFQTEYASLYDAETLKEIEGPLPARILIAAACYVEGVRLIDNVIVNPTPPSAPLPY